MLKHSGKQPKGFVFSPKAYIFSPKGIGLKVMHDIFLPKGFIFQPKGNTFKRKGNSFKPMPSVLKPKPFIFKTEAFTFKMKGNIFSPKPFPLKGKRPKKVKWLLKQLAAFGGKMEIFCCSSNTYIEKWLPIHSYTRKSPLLLSYISS